MLPPTFGIISIIVGFLLITRRLAVADCVIAIYKRAGRVYAKQKTVASLVLIAGFILLAGGAAMLSA
jgi:hypothetical protein